MNLVELNRHGSELVNITAWLTMAISLGWFVMSIVYVGIYVLWVPQEDLRAIVTTLVDDGILLLSIPWFLDHLVQYLVSAVITASLLFFSSLERLRRKEWARVLYRCRRCLSRCQHCAARCAGMVCRERVCATSVGRRPTACTSLVDGDFDRRFERIVDLDDAPTELTADSRRISLGRAG
jgi:hypothetical protein